MTQPKHTLQRKVKSISIERVSNNLYKRTTGEGLRRARNRILDRDEYTCRICHHLFSPRNLEVDHITPLHLGGSDTDDNRQTLCKACHKQKTDAEGKAR
jgi:5-methylcytosine-specific restriction protein A